MRIALTSNGPGEFSGWVRPLVAALERLAPETEIALFFVPDDYATGREDEVARKLFPEIAVFAARDYLRFALGRGLAGAPASSDVVLYLGGDLMHASRVRARLGGVLATYRFSSRRLAKSLVRAYAFNASNAATLARTGLGPDRIEIVGNLAVDGALGEAAGAFATRSGDDPRIAPNGVLILPGARKYEIAHLVPFFVQVALKLRALAPDVPVAFAISPFTDAGELDRALSTGGHPSVWGARGSVVEGLEGLWLQPEGDHPPIPVVRDAMSYASRARMALTIPGTKCIELAALGVPTMVCAPLNAPEMVVINGPLQYLDRIPFLGVPLKRAMVLGVDKRFPLSAQPNIDAGEELMPELRGTLMPGHVARRVAEYAGDDAARAAAAQRLRALYIDHAGAAERMARSLLALGP
jgi:lipid-A-disaccharide synthase